MKFIKEDNRIYLKNLEGKIIAEIEFEEVEKGKFNIYHTFVDESLRGQGIASKLIEEAIKEIKNRNGKVGATCSYAKRWLEKHNDNML
ncbi:MAG: N-acetyltransferase [Clostridia bacterium]|nr:N-acetyltransferase [Clostridia bacterium]